MDQDYTLKHLFNGNHYYFSTFFKCCYIICKPNCDILYTHARIGTNSLFANTTWIFSRISNLTLVHMTSHDLLFPMFTLWLLILMSFFHFLNISCSKAFVSANRTYYRQHQEVPGTSLSWFLYSIDEAWKITNRTNSRGLRTEPWCIPTPTPKTSLPLTFTLIVVSSYYTLHFSL